MMRKIKFLAVLLAVSGASVFAHTVDLAPSWRGMDRTTYQNWTFDDDSTPVILSNAAGSASATITVGAFGAGWFDNELELGQITSGYWDIGGEDGSIVLDIDNIPGGEYKLISIQITYYEAISAAPCLDFLPGAEPFEQENWQTIEVDSDQLGTWYVQQSTYKITPNPDFEQIVITGAMGAGSIIDQIIVDTICVPEPATLGMMLLGGLFLRKKK